MIEELLRAHLRELPEKFWKLPKFSREILLLQLVTFGVFESKHTLKTNFHYTDVQISSSHNVR